MAYGKQYNNYSKYNNYNNQQGNYGGNNNYPQQQQQQPVQPPVTPEQFIDERVAIHQIFVNRIKEQGLDPADFAFMLGGWVTSYVLEVKKNNK